MSKVNSFESDILELIFQNVDLANIGDVAGLQGATAAGNFYIALFTADPTDAGTVTAEADYTGYARKSVARNATEWTVTDGTATNANAITFAQCTGGSNTITHFGICKAGTAGVADLIYHGALNSSIAVSNNITPEISAGSLTVSEG